MIWVSAQEVIAFHDRILQWLPGIVGMSDPGRAEVLIYRVQNRTHDEGVTDVFELAATYWVAIARGHIFNDGNTLENLTVEAATGEKAVNQLAQHLRELTQFVKHSCIPCA